MVCTPVKAHPAAFCSLFLPHSASWNVSPKLSQLLMSRDTSQNPVDANSFYKVYHGHLKKDLELVRQTLVQNHAKFSKSNRSPRFMYLVGDSTLDNKFWLFPPSSSKPCFNYNVPEALNGYENVLNPPKMIPDISYWLNKIIYEEKTQSGDVQHPRDDHETHEQDHSSSWFSDLYCINAAVEATTVGERRPNAGSLLEQDLFVSQHYDPSKDFLVVSLGGNDIASKPSLATIFNLILVMGIGSIHSIRTGDAWGLRYFVKLFGTEIKDYIERILKNVDHNRVSPDDPSHQNNKSKPVIVVCMLYYLDEKPTGSWADRTLKSLGYDKNPEKLQTMIRSTYELGTKKISIQGYDIIPVPFFQVLNGKDTTDYVSRVEPSAKGGEKMAKLLCDEIAKHFNTRS